jgi:steroid delta-isomerase-like uncharacterized protein
MTNIEIVTQLLEEVWNKGEIALVDDIIAPGYFLKNDPGDPSEHKALDLSTFKDRVKLTRQAFPDLHFKIEEIITEDDKTVVSWIMSGTHQGDLPDFPATHKPFRITGITIYYLKDHKITGHWQSLDRLSLLGQLGVKIGK